MLIKKLGRKLVMDTKLYKPLWVLSPILMILSLLLLALIPRITQPYQFQQPSLRTKIPTVEPIPQYQQPYSKLNMQQIYPGVKLSIIYGRLTHQSVLVVARCQDQTAIQMLKLIHYNIRASNSQNKKLLAKNIGLMCHNSSVALDNFMKYQTSNMNYKPPYQYLSLAHSLGIIRNSLFITLPQYSASSKRVAQKVYFNIYSAESEVHTDLDFYQAIKQLLQQVGISSFEPCRPVSTQYYLSQVLRMTVLQVPSMSFAIKHALCHFHYIMDIGTVDSINKHRKIVQFAIDGDTDNTPSQYLENQNYIFMERSVQAATINVWHNRMRKNETIAKLARVTLGYLEEFVVFEDHLHSSATIFLPLSQLKYTPLKCLIMPAIVSMVMGAIHLILRVVFLLNKFDEQICKVKQLQGQPAIFIYSSLTFHTNSVHPRILLLIFTLYITSIEYYLNGSILLTLLVAALVRLAITRYTEDVPHRHIELVRILIAGVSLFITQYFAIFSLPVSIICSILTILICFTTRKLNFIIILLFVMFSIYTRQHQAVEILYQLATMSLTAQIVLYPYLFWVLVV